MKILIAEDDKAHQEINEILMEDWAFEFDMISNGQQAFDLAQANEGKYDLCLMDIDMPIMNGWDATKLIRQKLKYFPIVALTANPHFFDKYLEIGMDDYIEKPYDIDQLYKKINEVTVKSEIVYFKNNLVQIRKEMPVDANHAKELKELAKKDLCKMTLKGQNVTLIVHKNVPNKISHDFIKDELELSTFLDRNDEFPGECHLYKSSGLVPIVHFEEKQYQEKLTKEDDEMNKYCELAFKKEDPS